MSTGPRTNKRRGPAILRSPGLTKAGTHLLSPSWTTIGPEVFTTEFGMGSGVFPQALAPCNATADLSAGCDEAHTEASAGNQAVPWLPGGCVGRNS